MRTPNEASAPWKAQALMKVLDGMVKKLKKFGPINADPHPKKML